MYTEIRKQAVAMAAELAAWRRHLHAAPELSFKEHATTAFVAEKLASFGFSNVSTGFAPLTTGVMAELGGNIVPDAPCVALRADLDALPLQETLDVPWKSVNPGVMHACGHDAHTAVLLGAAKILKGVEGQLPGRVRFLFQPGEEVRNMEADPPLAGARYVVNAGGIDGVDAVFGLHVDGMAPAGNLYVREGVTMMSSARFTLHVHGKGTHGASPHLGADPIVCASAIVGAVQTLVSRDLDPVDSALLSVCGFQAGTNHNIIPRTATLCGTVRGISEELVAGMGGRLRDMAEAVAKGYRCTAELEFIVNGPPLCNDASAVRTVREAGAEILGREHVLGMPVLATAEDFREYALRRPSAFFFMGMADPDLGICHSLHDASFTVNDNILPDAAAMMAAIAWRFLEKGNAAV